MRIALLPLSLVVLALGLSAGPASASTADKIIKDCSSSDTGLLKGSYSKADLRAARKLVRGDIAEYTGCGDAISEALSQNGGGNGNGGNGSDGGNGSNGTDGGGSGTDAGGGTGGSSGGGFGDGTSDGLGSGGTSGGGTSGGSGTTGSDGTGAGTTGTDTGAAPVAPPTQQAGSGAAVAVGGEQITPGIPASFQSDQRALPTPLIVFLVLLAAGAIGFGAPTIGRRVLARRRG